MDRAPMDWKVKADWKPYTDMPPEYKDGRVVLLYCEDMGTFPMRWNPRGYNMISSRHKVGIWELDGGGMTWTDEEPEGAPELYALPPPPKE